MQGSHRHLLAALAAGMFLLAGPEATGSSDPLQLAALSERESIASGAVQTLPPDDLVKEAQELLTRLGRYAGPVDGQFNQQLAEALAGVVGHSSGSAELEPEPLLTRDVLDRIALMVDVGLMQDRLQEAAERQKDDARRALDGSSETRQLLGRAIYVPLDPERDSAGCFADPGARCLLTEALAAAEVVLDRKQRDWAYSEILTAQARAGLLENALATTSRLTDPRNVLAALRRIAASLADAGRFDVARDIANAIPEAQTSAFALLDVAASASQGGEAVLAAEIAELVGNAGHRPDGQGEIILRLAALRQGMGQSDEARRLRDRYLSDLPLRDDLRDAALVGLAESLADAGAPEQASEILGRRSKGAKNAVSARIAIAAAFGRAGDPDRGLAALAGIQAARYRAVGMAGLASIPELDPAMAVAIAEVAELTADRVELSYARSYAFARIAETWQKLGLPDRGVALLPRIDDKRLKATAVWRQLALTGGKGSGAGDDLVALARKSIDGMSDRLALVWLLCGLELEVGSDIARRFGEDGFLEEAIGVARSIQDPWFRARAWARIAEVKAASPEQENMSR